MDNINLCHLYMNHINLFQLYRKELHTWQQYVTLTGRKGTDLYWKCLVEIKMAFGRRYKISIIMSTSPSLSLKVTKPMPLCPGAGSSEEQQENISTRRWHFGGLHSKNSRERGSTGRPGRLQHRGDKSPCHHRIKACSDMSIHHTAKGSDDSHCLDHVKG